MRARKEFDTMPIYEYRCKACNHTFEDLVFGDEKPSCPKFYATKISYNCNNNI